MRSPRFQTLVAGIAAAGRPVLTGAVVVASSTSVNRIALGYRLPDIVMVYLLGVVLAAMRFGYAASLVTAALSVAALDFFFTEPYLSFDVVDKRYYVTFAIMLVVAVVISNLMNRLRRSAASIQERETRTAMLYAMSRQVSVAQSSDDIARVGCRHLESTFAGQASLFLASGASGGRRADAPEVVDGPQSISADVKALVLQMIASGSPASGPPRLERAPGGERLIALRASNTTLGVLVVRPSAPDALESVASRELLGTYANQIGLAIERANLAADAQRAQVEMQRERLRNALLSSVSHDFRTPLAVVTGAVTALLDREGHLPSRRRREYLETIAEEANRLNRLVRNLLNMTSLEAGALQARKEWHPLEEVVGVALNRLDDQLEERPVRVAVDSDANLVPFDAILLEQVLVNLVENVIRHTPAGSPVEIHARSVAGGVEVEVADRGPGLPDGEEEHVFEKFRRASSPTTPGMGLGLTICRGIIATHGGRIWCSNRPGGGASFRFSLPRDTEAPPMTVLPEVAGDA